MAKVEFTRVETDEEVEDISIKDGQLIYSKSGKTYMDYGDERIPTGSGGEGGIDIPQQPTAPENPEENDLWIDTDETGLTEVDSTVSTTSTNPVENQAITNYVNNLHTYSTTEQRVGTWINGKPLYRKVYNFTAPSSADVDSVIFTAPNNIDTMVNLYGMLTSANARFTLNSYYSTSYYIATYYNPTDGIRTKVGSNLVDRSGVAILEYTKTTD